METDKIHKRDVRDILRIIDSMINLIVDDEEIEGYRPLIEKIQGQLETINEDIEQKRKDDHEGVFGFAALHPLTEYPNQLTSIRN